MICNFFLLYQIKTQEFVIWISISVPGQNTRICDVEFAFLYVSQCKTVHLCPRPQTKFLAIHVGLQPPRGILLRVRTRAKHLCFCWNACGLAATQRNPVESEKESEEHDSLCCLRARGETSVFPQMQGKKYGSSVSPRIQSKMYGSSVSPRMRARSTGHPYLFGYRARTAGHLYPLRCSARSTDHPYPLKCRARPTGPPGCACYHVRDLFRACM